MKASKAKKIREAEEAIIRQNGQIGPEDVMGLCNEFKISEREFYELDEETKPQPISRKITGLYAFKKAVMLTVVTDFDEKKDVIVHEEIETFKKGEKFEADVLETNTLGIVNLQFGDGSVAFGVERKLFSKVRVA